MAKHSKAVVSEKPAFNKSRVVLQDLGPIFTENKDGSRSRLNVAIEQYCDNETGELTQAKVYVRGKDKKDGSPGGVIESFPLALLREKWDAIKSVMEPKPAKATKAA